MLLPANFFIRPASLSLLPPMTSPSFVLIFALNAQFICVKLGRVCLCAYVYVCLCLHKESTLARMLHASVCTENCFHFNLQSVQNLISSYHGATHCRRTRERDVSSKVHKYLITPMRKGMHCSPSHLRQPSTKCVLLCKQRLQRLR